MEFKQIEPVEDMAEVIQDVFGVKLDISGGWGYDHKKPVIVNNLDIPIDQFLTLFATIRANIEMNLTLEEHERYGGINVHFLDGEQFTIENKTYDHITFEITAMKEQEYAEVIQEYKDNYGKNANFDLDAHFNKRKELTLKVVADFWFEGLEEYYHDE
ncbi:MAG: hypothetical protein J7D61_10910 [Marichromatium sp.]|nr:hypothetical protein [Marichromatium sp.]